MEGDLPRRTGEGSIPEFIGCVGNKVNRVCEILRHHSSSACKDTLAQHPACHVPNLIGYDPGWIDQIRIWTRYMEDDLAAA